MTRKSFVTSIVLLLMFLSLQCAPVTPEAVDKKPAAKEELNLEDYEIIFDETPDKPAAPVEEKPLAQKTETPKTPPKPVEDPTEPKQQTPQPEDTPDGYLLAFMYPQGAYVLEQTQKINLDMTITIREQSQTQNITTELSQWMGLDVSAESEDSLPVMQAGITRLKMHTKTPNMEKTEDTDDPASLENDADNDVTMALLGKTAQVPLDSEGRINDIFPLAGIWDELINDYPDKAKEINIMKTVMGGGTLNQLAGQDSHFPKERVNVSDNWDVNSTIWISLLGEVSFNTSYTFTEIQQSEFGQIAIIDFSGSITKDLSTIDAGVQLPGGQTEITVPFTGQMRLWLDMGMLLDQTIDYEYEMNQSMGNNPEMPMEMSIKLKGRQSISLSAAE